MQCRLCQSDVPSGAFCGFCGAHLYALPGTGPDRLRTDSYVAEPNEQLLRLSLVSTLFPHLMPRSRTAFRIALGLLIVVLVVLALLRWQAAPIAVSVFGVPALFIAYVRQAGVRGDLGVPVVALTSLAGLALGAGWAYLTGPVLATTYLSVLGPGQGGARLLALGLSIPVLGRLLVMTAVRNDLALVAVAEGPMVRFTPRTSSHPSAVNMIIAQLLGNSVNSFTWNTSAAQ